MLLSEHDAIPEKCLAFFGMTQLRSETVALHVPCHM
jgi:hypothetical protein